MRQKPRIWLNLVVTLALLLTLFPVSNLSIAVAAGSPNPIVITDPMGDQSNPTQVSTSKINISGSFFGVTDISYTITQYRKLANGQLVPVKSRDGVEKPRISGSTFTFVDVELYDGLNEIWVKGNQNGQVVGDKKYVETTRLPVITSVMYNNQDLLSPGGNIITDRLFNDELVIKGSVVNAESISATVNGKNTEYTGSVLANNTYVIAKIPLQRGKNTLELVARNQNKTYPLKVEIFYEDGSPYVSGELVEPAVRKELRDPETFTTTSVTIEGKFNYFQSSTNDQLEVAFNENKFTITRADFDTIPISNSVTGATYSLTRLGNNGEFRLELNNVKQNQDNFLVFTFTRGVQKYIQRYTLSHFDPNLNYVTYVSGLNSPVTHRDITFYLETKNGTAPVKVEQKYTDAGGNTQIITLSTSSTSPPFEYRATLSPGINTFVVYPNSDDMNKKEYVVQYINSPDVKILNLVNGDRIGGSDGQPAELLAELINISPSDKDKTTLTIENRSGRAVYNSASTGWNWIGTSNVFKFDLTGKLASGANDIIIEVTDGVTTTQTRITVFFFDAELPSVQVDIDATRKLFPNDDFKEVEPRKYETSARYVHFKVNWNNANDLILYYNGTRVAHVENADDVTRAIIPESGWENYFDFEVVGSTVQIISKYPFTLIDGQNTFEAEGVSEAGTSYSDKVYIQRYQPPVKVVKPDLERENVVNSNYIEIIIETAADQVFFGKTEAKYEKLSPQELNNIINALPPELKQQIIKEYDIIIVDGMLDENELELVDQSKITNKRFVTEYVLKPGKNKVSYDVVVNGKKTRYDFEIFYAASPTEGAKYKELFNKSKFSVFDKKVNLEFPKNTWLVKQQDRDQGIPPIFDQFQSDAYIKFGIVDRSSGKLNKIWVDDGTGGKYELEDFEEPYKTIMPVRFLPPDRTGYAGQIYWIEADGDIKNVLSGYVPTNRGKLSLAYDPAIRDDAQNLLSIYHYDREKNEWVNIGGVVDTKKKTVTAYIYEFGYYTVMAKRGTYNDIYNHWAINYLTAMYAKGLMMPESSNRFGSDGLTSRGEFSTILVKAMELPINAGPYVNGDKRYPVNPTFVDVNPLLDPPNGFYSYEYIETAGRAGIIRGMGQGEFVPDGLLTREQAAIMIARAANLKLQSDVNKARNSLSKTYADVNTIGDYALPYVEAVLKAGIMAGTPIQNSKLQSFEPARYLTRAEAAAIAYKLMQNQKKLPK